MCSSSPDIQEEAVLIFNRCTLVTLKFRVQNNEKNICEKCPLRYMDDVFLILTLTPSAQMHRILL